MLFSSLEVIDPGKLIFPEEFLQDLPPIVVQELIVENVVRRITCCKRFPRLYRHIFTIISQMRPVVLSTLTTIYHFDRCSRTSPTKKTAAHSQNQKMKNLIYKFGSEKKPEWHRKANRALSI